MFSIAPLAPVLIILEGSDLKCSASSPLCVPRLSTCSKRSRTSSCCGRSSFSLSTSRRRTSNSHRRSSLSCSKVSQTLFANPHHLSVDLAGQLPFQQFLMVLQSCCTGETSKPSVFTRSEPGTCPVGAEEVGDTSPRCCGCSPDTPGAPLTAGRCSAISLFVTSEVLVPRRVVTIILTVPFFLNLV